MMWDPRIDSFKLHITDFTSFTTKQTILSYVTKMYDSLGTISPVTFYIKWLLQKLWLIQVGWDDPLPTDISTNWLEFSSELSQLSSSLQIPSFIGSIQTYSQLIGEVTTPLSIGLQWLMVVAAI